MDTVISISQLGKVYSGGFRALDGVDLNIRRGEILALLGPNGAGKTTLISSICGIVTPSEGHIAVMGHDVVRHYRRARQHIGLVPQELNTDSFETVRATVNFSRGLFGKPPNPAFVDDVLKTLSLWDKRDARIMTLSGGMKRRVMIAKALSHEPDILFLDEPTAGVDVELRKDMWAVVRKLRERGVTIILTTHYIEEAEEMADRIGIINHGRLVLVDDKNTLIRQLGKRQLRLSLQTPLAALPDTLSSLALTLDKGGEELVFTFDSQHEHTGIAELLRSLERAGIEYRDLSTHQSSLEDIFVSLIRDNRNVEAEA